MAGETVFFLPFVVVRIFRPTFLDAFSINNFQLGTAFSFYGIVAMVSYFLGGPIADRFSPKKLMSAALILTGLGGFKLMTFPSTTVLSLLYGFWGMTTILLFWSALIKTTRIWGGRLNQGTAYGLLDAGRGLLAAILASVSVWAFATILPQDISTMDFNDQRAGMRMIILSYSIFTILVGLLVYLVIPDTMDQEESGSIITLSTIKSLASRPIIWLQAIIVLCAYVGYKCTDDFSLYASDVMGYDDVKAASFGTISYWTRPLIAVIAGFTADRYLSSKVIIGGFFITIIGSVLMSSGWIAPSGSLMLAASIIILSIGIYAMRGVYFALLQEGKIQVAVSGTAIGIISVVGFTPDIFMGPLMGYLIDNHPGAAGHQYVFSVLGGFSMVGLMAAFIFYIINTRTSEEHQ